MDSYEKRVKGIEPSWERIPWPDISIEDDRFEGGRDNGRAAKKK